MCKFTVYVVSLFLALFLNCALAESVKLYICTKNGEVTLQGAKPDDCDRVQTFDYSYKQLTKEEILDREAKKDSYYTMGPVITKKVKETRGFRYQTPAEQQCLFYGARIADSLVAVERRPEDALDVRRMLPQIERDKAQYEYYCGKSY